jgi:hypothetical protein
MIPARERGADRWRETKTREYEGRPAAVKNFYGIGEKLRPMERYFSPTPHAGLHNLL